MNKSGKTNKKRIKKVIKIAHIHVWDRKNKGDYAIVLAVQELLRREIKNCEIIDFPVEVLKNFSLASLKKINGCEAIFIGGGGILYSYFLPFDQKMIQAIKPPLFLFGLGYIKEIGSKDWPKKNISSVIALADKAQKIGVRDFNTKRFLESNGIEKNKLHVIGDPAFVLKEKKPTIQTIDKLKLKNKNIKIGLNLNYSGWLGFGLWRDDILLAYKEVISYFKNNFEADIYYLKHHPGEEKIYRQLGLKDIIKVDLPPQEQKYVYRKMDLIIGMMLHVGVMSCGALTPEISVAYDIRNYGFAEFIRHKELVVDLEKLKSGALLDVAKKVFRDRKIYQNSFKKLKTDIFEKETKFLQDAIKSLTVL